MKSHAVNHLTSFYNCSERHPPIPDLNIIIPITVSREVKAWLRYFPNENEIRTALFSFDSNKSPGPADIIVEVLKHHWPIVKKKLISTVLWFFENRKMIRVFNHTYVTLIPKKVASSTLADYRPISSVSTPYKLIAKILANEITFA